MTLAEQIQLHVQQLPSEKQGEVLDFFFFFNNAYQSKLVSL